jgi:hypothetical protein
MKPQTYVRPQSEEGKKKCLTLLARLNLKYADELAKKPQPKQGA